MVLELCGVRGAKTLVVLVVQLDLGIRCLEISDQIHQVALLQAGLILHISADSLHWREVAQITVLCKSGGKCTLGAVEQLRVRQLVFWLL